MKLHRCHSCVTLSVAGVACALKPRSSPVGGREWIHSHPSQVPVSDLPQHIVRGFSDVGPMTIRLASTGGPRAENGRELMGDPRYGNEHQKLRAAWKQRIESGEVVLCHHLPGCTQEDPRIYPGTPWDLEHRDDDPTQYLGPGHRICNRGTARIWKQRALVPELYVWMP